MAKFRRIKTKPFYIMGLTALTVALFYGSLPWLLEQKRLNRVESDKRLASMGKAPGTRAAPEADEEVPEFEERVEVSDSFGGTEVTIRVGGRVHPSGVIRGDEEVLDPKDRLCYTATDQPSLVVEKIVDDYVRVRYDPAKPSSILSKDDECPIGSRFMVRVSSLIIAEAEATERRKDRERRDAIKKQITAIKKQIAAE